MLKAGKPRCPQCGKLFNHTDQVQRHLDQPRSKCHQQRTTFVDPGELLGHSTDARHDRYPHLQRWISLHDSDRELSQSNFDVPQQSWTFGQMNANNAGTSDSEEATSADITQVEYYPEAAKVVDRNGVKFTDSFDDDKFAGVRVDSDNLYYPFASRPEWELADFLLTSSLSMATVDRFLGLSLVQQLQLSFKTASRLRGLAEILPKCPPWKCREMNTSPHETKTVARLFYRDSIDCLQTLLHNPLFIDSIDFCPYRVFTTAQRIVRVYSEWMSGDTAWEIQAQLPIGACTLGIILSSDKTNVTNQTGGKVSHPLLMSLANLHAKVWAKASLHAFVPLAFLPIVDFIHDNSRMKSVLSDRLYHQCLDVVVEPLKIAARIGVMLSDPVGNSRYCFTLLAGCVIDTPEACLIACVRRKTSPTTLADYTQFGDPVRHPSQTKAITLAFLESIDIDPNDLPAYFEACGAHRLNGVASPFWRDWPLSDPAKFFPPEVLHLFTRFCYDHDLKWCIRALGAEEIDFRFSIIQPITGHRHFATGVTKLKQVTGRTQCDLQRYIIPVIAGAAPSGVIRAIRALIDFRYIAQSPLINDNQCQRISAALEVFHANKQSILDANLRLSEKGNALDHWQIPKLELMQNVAPSIPLLGPPINWTADITERAHIDVVKIPATATNNIDFESQICRHLDRHEKCRAFSLALCIREKETNKPELCTLDSVLSDDDDDRDKPPSGDDNRDKWLGVPRERFANYFTSSAQSSQVLPPRSFVSGPVAFHLRFDPVHGSIDISDVAEKFSLPDLPAALVHYFYRNHDTPLHVGGQRHHRADEPLPFKRLQVWYKVRLQQKAYHDPNSVLPAQTLNASPPTSGWPMGRYDAAFINVNNKMVWPHSGLQGHLVGEIRLIFRPIPPRERQGVWWSTQFLVYVVRLDVLSMGDSSFDEVTGMHILKRATRTSGIPMGDVIPLCQLRALAPLVPRFGVKADPRLTAQTSSRYSNSFYLNHFFDPELYYALSTV